MPKSSGLASCFTTIIQSTDGGVGLEPHSVGFSVPQELVLVREVLQPRLSSTGRWVTRTEIWNLLSYH